MQRRIKPYTYVYAGKVLLENQTQLTDFIEQEEKGDEPCRENN
ncbi:MAG: hypothetical protein Q6368_003085 [Candidatus Baldrarchaeota archaeon]